MLKEKDTWNKITTRLKSEIPKAERQTWFSYTTLKRLDPDLAVIEVPNKFVASWLRDNYLIKIQNCFKSNLDILPEIHFTYSPPHRNEGSPITIRQYNTFFGSHHQLDPELTFDNFLTAKSNRLAHSSALELASNLTTLYSPLYLFCEQGLGKTHLLNAISHHILETMPSVRLRYLTMSLFQSDLSTALKNNNLMYLRQNYADLDLFLLDDIHQIAGDTETQEELSYIINLFYEAKKPIVFAAKKAPVDIDGLISELRSRLEWGILTEILPPDQKTKIKFIKKTIRQEKLPLDDDAIFFLANATNDFKILSQYLARLQNYASLYDRPIDISTLKWIIKGKPFYSVNVNDILKAIARYFNVSLSDLKSSKKSRKFSYPRQIAMYLIRNLTSCSLKDIGALLGHKDHSTVIYAIKRIKTQKDIKPEIMEDIQRVNNLIL